VKNLSGYIKYIAGINLFIYIFISFAGCSGEKKEYVDIPFDGNKVPTMATDSITELISDSGLIRYKLITKTWLFYDRATEPYWHFPDGVYLEQFDTNFQIEATLKADTVWNYRIQNLWKLKGNVFIRNSADETFKSNELFWDQKSGKVYSNAYIEINRPEKALLKGYGFESNQQMTEYQIKKLHNTDIYVEEQAPHTFPEEPEEEQQPKKVE